MDRFPANLAARAFLASTVAMTVLYIGATSGASAAAANSRHEVAVSRAAADDSASDAFRAWLIYRSGERGDASLPLALAR